MSEFVFHPEAHTDLAEIWKFIASANPDAADRIIDEIHTGSAVPDIFFLVRGTGVLTLLHDHSFSSECEIISSLMPQKKSRW